MSASRQALGRWGEVLAGEYLEARGYQILEFNARTSYGEIDLVARHETGVLVFVEVKTRSSRAYGLPEDAITAEKQEHMLNSAQAYIQAHPELEENWRLDLVAIQRYRSGREPQIIHFENVLT